MNPLKIIVEKSTLRLLLVMGLSWSFSVSSVAQVLSPGTCGTASPGPEHLSYLEAIGEAYRNGLDLSITRRDSGGLSRIYIPFKAHIVRAPGSNNYMQVPALLTTLCELNQKYRASGIQFYLKDLPNYIFDGSLYYHTGWTQGNTQMTTYNMSRVVNVHFVDLSAMGLCGYATFPGSGAGTTLRQGGLMMSVPCSQPGNTTLAHEMGHYLALPHPFEGTSPQPQGVFAERVTRNSNEPAPRLNSNCATAGDRFCDTPADFIGNRWPCNGAAPQDTDINGDAFRPDATLFMSYSNDNCQNKFSAEQMNVMRYTLTGTSGGNGPRSYLLLPPMPAYDSVRSSTTLIEPAAGAPASPANWVYFKWTAAPNATMYYVRVVRGITLMFERWVSDTSLLYTGPDLASNGNYSVTVRPFNPASTCAPSSPSRSFTTTTPFGLSTSGLIDQHFRVYPTVLRQGDPLFCQFSEAIEGIDAMEITVRSIQGQSVYQNRVMEAQALQTIATEKLSPGIYTLEARAGRWSKAIKIIVQ